VKLNAFPAASTAFAPARPARFAALFGGMAKSAAVAVAGADPDADGQGTAAAELATAGALAAGALAAGALALAAGALAAGALAAGALALPLAAAEAHEPRADCATVVVLPPETAMMIPRVRPSATGMARGTAIRAARLLLLRRRDADRCPLSIQSTSMDVRCAAPGASP
jgi:hypothetical protein